MEKRLFTDDIGRNVEIPFPPKRVVCLVPSISELVFDLEIENRFVGVTRFCIHPSSLKKDLVKVGGTKKVNFEKISALNPDLIIANKEENDKDQIEFLSKQYPTWISDIGNLSDALNMITCLGTILDNEKKAQEIRVEIESGFNEIKSKNLPSCLYLIWKNPYMAAGNNTFIHDLISRVGFKSVMANQERYPSLTQDEIATLNPELVMLSSEPFPFAQKHIDEIQTFLPDSKIILVDGELFSWYGSRLMKSPEYFQKLITENFSVEKKPIR